MYNANLCYIGPIKVNATVVDVTPFEHVQSQYDFYPFFVHIVRVADNVTSEPTVTLGTNSTAFDDVLATVDLTDPAIKLCTPVVLTDKHVKLKCNVSGAAVADKYKLEIRVFGYFSFDPRLA